MVINNIVSVKITQQNMNTMTQVINVEITYNDSSVLTFDSVNNYLSLTHLTILYALFVILERAGYVDRFNLMMNDMNLEYSQEPHHIFSITRRAKTSDPRDQFEYSKLASELRDDLEINWDSIDIVKLINYELETV